VLLGQQDCATIDNPQIGLSKIAQFLKVTDYCGDERAVILPNSILGRENFIKLTDFQVPEAARFEVCQQ
jgi:hypothetical protein